MNIASATITISLVGDTQEQADGRLLLAFRRFVRAYAGVLDLDPADVMAMEMDELKEYAAPPLKRFLVETVLADVSLEADALKQAAVEQARQLEPAFGVVVQEVPS